MKSLYCAVLLVGMAVPSLAQMYLLAGSPNSMNGWSVASDLFEVQAGGDLRLAARLVPQKVGTEWIAVSYDWRKAVIVPGHNDNRVVVIDFDRADASRSCELPAFSDGHLAEQWLADLPGVGQSFVGHTAGTRDHLYAIKLDASTPCVDSVVEADPSAVRYVEASGRAGVASLGVQEGILVGIDAEGAVFGWRMGTKTPLGYSVPADLRAGFGKPNVLIVANTRQVLVLGLYQKEAGYRILALSKATGGWHTIPVATDSYWCVRAFGGFVAIAEARNRQGHEKEFQSAGKPGWRTKSTAYGPIIGSIIEGASAAFTGRLHLYDVDHGRLFTITTDQADSEVLLIDGQTVYYRVVDSLYSADVTDKGIQGQRLILKSDVIDDVHWAFMGRAGR